MRPTDSGGPRSDGGTADRSVFETRADVSVTRQERLRRLFDRWVSAPFRIIWSDKRFRAGFSIVLFYVLMGTIGVVLVPVPTSEDPSLVLPFQSLQYPLGTDGLGQQLGRSIVHATPPMLKMMAAGALFSTAVATIVGTVSGYKGGLADRVLTTFTDMMMTIPGLPLVIVIAAILSPRSPYVVGIILTINAWAGLARAIRSQVLTIRDEAYVEASRIIGKDTGSIITEEILPNLMPYVMINFVNSARNVIFASVGLYFLGILPFTSLNWGVMMNMAYRGSGALYSLESAHWFIVPMATIVILSYGLILLSQGSDRLFNPRVRARHAKTVAKDENERVEEEEGSSTPNVPST